MHAEVGDDQPQPRADSLGLGRRRRKGKRAILPDADSVSSIMLSEATGAGGGQLGI